MDYIYDWETCLILTDEWARMIERRSEKGWRMVSASVTTMDGKPVAYIFWESEI